MQEIISKSFKRWKNLHWKNGFQNLTKDVLDQKDTNRCVSVSVLLRWAIKNDLRADDDTMEIYFTVEKILTSLSQALTMIIYPQSLVGMNFNPKNKEKKFQQNEIELLLKRMKYETYLHKSGWDIIREQDFFAKGTFDFKQGKNKSSFSSN